MQKIKGIGAYQGLSLGKAFVIDHEEIKITKTKINAQDVDKELKRAHQAINQIKQSIQTKYEKHKAKLGEKAEIFMGHLSILEDPSLEEQLLTNIQENLLNAESSINQISQTFQEMMLAIDDAYMKERALDIKDVFNQVLASLLGKPIQDYSSLNEEVIVIAYESTPSDTILFDPKYIKGIVNEIGSKTSHVAIIAQGLDIPIVVGAKHILSNVKNNDLVVINATTGEIIINPTASQVKEIKQLIEKQNAQKEHLKKLINKPTITKDAHEVKVEANIGNFEDAQLGYKNGAQGVGLFRTEFLYMDNSDWPTEEEQFKVYKQIAQLNKKFPNIVRTLDIGGDKHLSYFQFEKEENPFLGYRAIRFCLDNLNIFKAQIRALLRASAFGDIQIMLPMISNLDEINKAKTFIEKCKKELTKEAIAFDKNIKIGIMIEIPAAAVHADVLAKHVDFFSIGTNDLIQYTMATDRMSQKVSYLYQPLNPAIIKLIKLAIDGAHLNNKTCAVCGAMGSERLAIPLLLGLGLDYFSVSPNLILQTRALIRNLNFQACQELAQKAIRLPNETAVIKLVESFLDAIA